MSDFDIKIHARILLSPFVPQSRRAHNIELKGAVVIFDEAHNVVSLCPAHSVAVAQEVERVIH